MTKYYLMRHTKVYFTVTSTLLSIVGIAFTKSHRFDGLTRMYCTSVPTTTKITACVFYDSAPFEEGSGTGAKTAIWTLVRLPTSPNIKYTLYTNFDVNDRVCRVSNANSCGHKLTFTSHE